MKKLQITIIILVSLIAVILVYLSFPKEKVERELPLEKAKVTLSLVSAQREFTKGEEFPVEVILETAEFGVDGVDVILNYNPEFVEFKRIDMTNSVFETFPSQSIEKEQIKFSALTPPQETFRGKGKVAIVFFQTIEKGEDEIHFDFQPGFSTDSNVASQGKDILEKVDNLKILIK